MSAPTHDLTPTETRLDQLRAHPRNPRRSDLAGISESLRVNGQYKPIVVTADGTILAGNHTAAAARAIGWDTIQTVTVAYPPDSPEALRILVADNKTSDQAARLYDLEQLDAILSELADLDALTGTAYTADDLADLELIRDTPTPTPTPPADPEPAAADPDPDPADPPPTVGDAPTETPPPIRAYGVLVECQTEPEQRQTLTDLHAAGYTVTAT